MGKRDDIEELFEFRFQFHHVGSDYLTDRHFTAVDSSSAMRMFEFACSKDDLEVEIVSIEKWNRWSNRWESMGELVEGNVESII